ncbi:protein kinase [Angomonas deanei]|uniref:Protein kinase domain containing protein, putative n=1 Tax=Angomonas deanei TaxID=59799 RepID=A0A7G2CEP1_9TRYP|nr:protein kinase [Angomonas deanei]CAD2217334.1 Protein kinase domain containing protein, putative [Angomonas deanei]|eukprot:EPY22211.1 protein kinase [Angomonas deanei]
MQPNTPPRPERTTSTAKRGREEDPTSSQEVTPPPLPPPPKNAAQHNTIEEEEEEVPSPHAVTAGDVSALITSQPLPSSVEELLKAKQGRGSLLDSPPKKSENDSLHCEKRRHEEEQDDIIVSVQRKHKDPVNPTTLVKDSKNNTHSFKDAMRKKSFLTTTTTNNNNKASEVKETMASSSSSYTSNESPKKAGKEDNAVADKLERSDSSSSAYSASSSTSSSSSESDDEKTRYPRFDEKYRRQLDSRRQSGIQTPFLRFYNNNTKTVLYGRYEYVGLLGKGTYSKVVLAKPIFDGVSASTNNNSTSNNASMRAESKGDHRYSEEDFITGGPYVALKIFRNESSYRDAALEEATVLHLLSQPPRSLTSPPLAGGPSILEGKCLTTLSTVQNSPFKEYYSRHGRFVTFEEYIPHLQHPALVFPCMGSSLYEVIRRVRKTGKAESRRRFYKEWMRLKGNTNNNNNEVEDEEAKKKMKKQMKEDFKDAEERQVWLRGFPPYLVKSVLYQLLLFLKYVHSRGVAHTDLKPENIVFESTHTVPYDFEVCSMEYLPKDKTNNTDTNNAMETQLEQLNLNHSPTKQEEGAPFVPQINARRRSLPPPPDSPVTARLANFRHAFTMEVPLPLTNQVKVIDLGAAELFESFRHVSPIKDPKSDTPRKVSYFPIQTTHYRSPEVLLDLGWDSSADLFSVGCMIPELVTGECVFMPQDTLEHLAMLEQVIGPFQDPQQDQHAELGVDILRDVFATNKRTFSHYFHEYKKENSETTQCALKWPVSQDILRKEEKLEKIKKQQGGKTNYGAQGGEDTSKTGYGIELEPLVLTPLRDIKFVKKLKTIDEMLAHEPLLLDLTKKLLNYHPFLRPTAAEALEHPYFQHD